MRKKTEQHARREDKKGGEVRGSGAIGKKVSEGREEGQRTRAQIL